jgi:two-component system chemotaxis response regulator CheB
VVARRVISDIFASEDDFELVGTAPNGWLALTKIERLQPKLVTLDIDMPGLDGLQTLTEIRARHPDVRVIMVSNLTRRGASVTVEALFLGASDYVTKATQSPSAEEARRYLKDQLVPKARALVSPVARGRNAPRPAAGSVPVRPANAQRPAEVVVIGASTGGPNALTEVLTHLPQSLPAAILIVQHLPANFTTHLARRLDAACPLPVHEAAAGDTPAPGEVWIAPGNQHLEVRRTGDGFCLATTDGAPVNSCRPAADVLFRSAAECFGASTLAVVLTGMGQDGLKGCKAVRLAGGQVIAQDRDTSVVWGMPGQVASAGLADVVLPLPEIGDEITRRVRAGRR